MNYQKFIADLPGFYANWGQEIVHPKAEQFQATLAQVEGMTTANVLQLLNFAVACMEPGEVYCEVGCFRGSTLIGALLNQPNQMAYAVDNFSEFDPEGENYDHLMHNLVAFGLETQVFFCNQGFEEFFADLRELQTSDRIGVYFYDGAHDYRSQLMGLLLVRPFLADRALIVVGGSNWDAVQQANWDFVAAHPQCQLVLELPTSARPDEMVSGSFWHGLHVISWDIHAAHHQSWASLQSIRKPALIQAIYNLPPVFEWPESVSSPESISSPDPSSDSRPQAVPPATHSLQATESLAAIAQKYLELLQQDRSRVDLWQQLGVTYTQMERYEDAAIAYQQAISIAPGFVDAYTNLGNLVANHGDPQQAEAIYQQAIAHNPGHVGSYLNLGNVLLMQKKIEAAISAYEAALALDSTNGDGLANLAFAQELAQDEGQACLFAGNSLYQRQRYFEAAQHYQRLLDRVLEDQAFGDQACEEQPLANPPPLPPSPRLPFPPPPIDRSVYRALANCYEKTRQHDRLIQVCWQAIAQFPDEPHFHTQLIQTLQETNQTEAAIAQATQAMQQFPAEIWFKIQHYLLLPVLYETQAEILAYRQRFTTGLSALIREIVLAEPGVPALALSAIGYHTNFWLAYQNDNDLELQKQYGEWVHRLMAANYPEWVEPRSLPPVTDRIRIGYVSGCLRDHTIGKLILGWFRHHNRDQFQIHAYHLSDIDDGLSQEFRRCSDRFYQIPNDLERVSQQILADQLHILVFPEIGMQPLVTQLAALRLAPVQCASWAHPVTSGLPTVDYFLSSDLMEPEDGEAHYAETLIRLPQIGIAFAKPEVPAPALSRSAFQLRDDAVVYLACQSLFKYPPEQDRVFAAIAQQVPQAQFVFVNRPNPTVAAQFQARLQQAFAAVGLDSEQFCVMLPAQSQAQYWNLNQVSDVFLDSFGWSGGHTTLEAIACNLPVVTCPGEFMRGRHSAAILTMMGITDTIASTADDYIQIAVRCGTEPIWREVVVQRMGDRHSYLYDDPTCVTALETFYRQACASMERRRVQTSW